MIDAGHDGWMDGRHVGRVFRAIREHLGWSQAELGTKAGVTQTQISSVERGSLVNEKVATIDRIATALGAAAYLDIRYEGGRADRLVDRVHAALVDLVATRLRADSWEVVLEYSFNVFGERGSIDLLAWHAATRTLLIVEVKSVFHDLQDLLHALSRKLRLGPDLVRKERGWDPTAVGRIVVTPGTSANRAVVARHSAIFDVSLPARTIEVRRWLRNPVGPLAGVWFVPTSQVPVGRQASRARGRRESRRRLEGPQG
jgi:transcriptional regulator with XRE-family HTH domain